MKASQLSKLAVLLLVSGALVTGAFAGSRKDRSDDGYAYVFVTGSNIPQKVKIRYLGTTTYAAMTNYSRREIDQTGRATLEGVLALDPSLHVRQNNADAGSGN